MGNIEATVRSLESTVAGLAQQQSRLKGRIEERGNLGAAVITVIGAVLASLFATFAAGIWTHKGLAEDLRNQMEAQRTQMQEQMAQLRVLSENAINEVRTQSQAAMSETQAARELANEAGEIILEAQRQMALLGGVEGLQERFDQISFSIGKIDGLLSVAGDAVVKAVESKDTSLKISGEIDAIKVQSEEILEQVDAMRELVAAAQEAARKAKDYSRETSLNAESAILLAKSNYEQALDSYKSDLRIGLGEWAYRDPNVVHEASASGLVVASIEVKKGVSRKSGGVCGYSGQKEYLGLRGDERAAAYVNLGSNQPKASLLMPVRQGDYWLVTHCSETTSNEPDIMVYWTKFQLQEDASAP